MEYKFSIVCRDTREKLVKVLNNAPLPPDALVWIVRDLYEELNKIAETQYKKDLEEIMKETENEAIEEKESEDGNV